MTTDARPILITGAAGFIGAALAQRLLQRGDRVVGIDSLNSYYDPSLKQARLQQIEAVAAPAPGASVTKRWKPRTPCRSCLPGRSPGWW